MEQGIGDKDQSQSHGDRYEYIGRGMYAEVHTGKRNQDTERDGNDTKGASSVSAGNSAKETDRALSMTAGEGISRSGVSCRFHDGKIRVFDPRAGDAAEHFQKLVRESSYKANGKQVVALLLTDTPKVEDSRRPVYV